ncbi:hypothetical protein COO60DRAFT_367088 [Scenedesmus sp. NREL 46B-D3]|nr:hypothetical protein COO60DRAFT_367088 [Scenedesmus sp. NREL 46B-D3]
MFGAACRECSYQPLQLMAQFRSWLLLQLARQGSSALLKLSTRTSAAHRAAAAAARRSTAAAARAATRDSNSSSELQQQQQQQQQGGAAAGTSPLAATPHANVLVCVLMLLRQVSYADRALLQQLELAASHYPAAQQLTGQQLVMCLSSFRRLGHFPAAWWAGGLRALLDRHAAQLSGRDCVELLEVLAAWRHMPGVGSSTRMRQRVLPRLQQRLLGQVWAPKQAAGSGSSRGSRAVISSADSSPARSPASSLSSSDGSEQEPMPLAAAGSTEASDSAEPAAAAAAVQRRPAGANLIAELSGPQTVWLLHSIGQLGLGSPQLKRQAFRRLQAVWPQLQVSAQVAAAAAAGRLGYDATAMLQVADLTQQGVSGGAFRSVSAAARTLWTFGNLGKHPGPALVDAALSHVAAAAAAANNPQQQQGVLPLREMSTALYAAAVLHELSHPAALLLLQQLQQAAAAGQLLGHPQFAQQSPQLAACLLVSQPAAAASLPAGRAATTEMPDTSAGSDSATNPWLGFSREVQQRLQESWRRRVLRRSQSRPHALQQELAAALRQLGLRCKPNAVTPDGCVCIDIAATSPQGDVLAVELLGPHNAAANTQRPLGPARLKWRLLTARGYRVVVINTWQWRSLEGPTRSRDDVSSSRSPAGSPPRSFGAATGGLQSSGAQFFSEKVLFLQSRLAPPMAAALMAATAAGSGASAADAVPAAAAAAVAAAAGDDVPDAGSSMDVSGGSDMDGAAGSSSSSRSSSRRLWPGLQRPMMPPPPPPQQQH